jgi:hypothetical protein
MYDGIKIAILKVWLKIGLLFRKVHCLIHSLPSEMFQTEYIQIVSKFGD